MAAKLLEIYDNIKGTAEAANKNEIGIKTAHKLYKHVNLHLKTVGVVSNFFQDKIDPQNLDPALSRLMFMALNSPSMSKSTAWETQLKA